MKIIKNPWTELVFCIVAVVLAFCLSVSIKLGNKVDGVKESFSGSQEADSLFRLCTLADELVPVAGNYGLRTAELSEQSRALADALSSDEPDVTQLRPLYDELRSTVELTLNTLSLTGVSRNHTGALESFLSELDEITAEVDSADYNGSVTRFEKSFDKWPVNRYANWFGIEYPKYF